MCPFLWQKFLMVVFSDCAFEVALALAVDGDAAIIFRS